MSVSVAGPVVVDAGSFSQFKTGIFSDAVQGSTGRAGTVTLSAASLQIRNGSAISSSTYGPGAGGDVNLNVSGAVQIVGSGRQVDSNITVESNLPGAGGPGGNINLNAGSLQLQDGGLISSATSGLGNSGDVRIAVKGQAILTGTDPLGLNSDITSQSYGAGTSGNAGDITLSAANLQLLNGGLISSSTLGTGHGGATRVTAESVFVGGTRQPGITSSSRGTATGDGGSVTVQAGVLRLAGTGSLDTSTAGAGNAGDILARVGSFSMTDNAELQSNSTGTGNAGDVTVRSAGPLALLAGATASTAAPHATGGQVELTSGGNLTLDRATVTTQAARDGGSILLSARNLALIQRSRITSLAGVNGGNIRIDPESVMLRDSSITADGGADGGNVTIRPVVLLQSDSPISATGTRGISGQVLLTDPDPSLAGALVPLPGALWSNESQLAPQCGIRLGPNVSSFIVTGRGGTPDGAGGLLFELP